MQLIRIWMLLFFVVLGVSNPTYAKKLKADSNWVAGTLENGLKYHIYPTDDAEVSIRLVIHAGSLQENEQQKGYAHFVEHMAFNGSRNFAGNDIIKIIEQSGKQFGPDINAFTAYQTTVYQLDLASKAQLDTGLTWMRDIADGISFDAQQVEKEKGAILGEFRFSRPENQDLYTKAYLKLIGDSVLADADPLGSEQSVQQATVAGLKGYYQKWYQPQNAELIVVGDVNAAVLAQQLQQQFSNWVSNGDAPTRKQRKFNYDLASNVFTIGDNQSPTLFYVIDRNASDRITKQKQLHRL